MEHCDSASSEISSGMSEGRTLVELLPWCPIDHVATRTSGVKTEAEAEAAGGGTVKGLAQTTPGASKSGSKIIALYRLSQS